MNRNSEAKLFAEPATLDTKNYGQFFFFDLLPKPPRLRRANVASKLTDMGLCPNPNILIITLKRCLYVSSPACSAPQHFMHQQHFSCILLQLYAFHEFENVWMSDAEHNCCSIMPSLKLRPSTTLLVRGNKSKVNWYTVHIFNANSPGW